PDFCIFCRLNAGKNKKSFSIIACCLFNIAG
ncbi:MAG: hypothetical protein ACI8UC_001010, partial [Psychromonas sp.]